MSDTSITMEAVMHNDWPEMAKELDPLAGALRQGQPDPMKGFSAMAQAILKADARDTKTKELIASSSYWPFRRPCAATPASPTTPKRP